MMGHPPKCLEGGQSPPAWVRLVGAPATALSGPHQALRLISGGSKVPWLPCLQVSVHPCPMRKPATVLKALLFRNHVLLKSQEISM